jgi:hypothetical protein
LRRGDVLYPRASATEGAGSEELRRALQRLTVRWRVELVMRKRKREPRAADADAAGGMGGQAETVADIEADLPADMGTTVEDEEEHSAAPPLRGACAAAGARIRVMVDQGEVAGATREHSGSGGGHDRRDGKDSGFGGGGEDGRASGGGGGGGNGEDDVGQLSSSIGSDTEWSEGFSSDDNAGRRSRPSRHLRALARRARGVHLASSVKTKVRR